MKEESLKICRASRSLQIKALIGTDEGKSL